MKPSRATSPMVPRLAQPLAGWQVLVTRPAQEAAVWHAAIRRLGGVPLSLPGLRLAAATDLPQARQCLQQALQADRVIFTSPAAVRFAAHLLPLPRELAAVAVGAATARALARHGVRATQPSRQDSEGVLALELWGDLAGQTVGLVGGGGGREVLQQELAARRAMVHEAAVYQRLPPKLGRRQLAAVQDLSDCALLLLSSAEAVRQLKAALPMPAWQRLIQVTAIVSSARLAAAAQEAGWRCVLLADSALRADMLAAASRFGAQVSTGEVG